jgi:hypothetical protein
MLTIKPTGSIAEVIRHARDVHGRVVPYAASTALTRVAGIAAKQDLPNAMRAVFDRPTTYTLNSLFVVPATKDSLTARVHVKNAAASGIVPERFLAPEVEGGSRGEKRFERALRYAGILLPNERALPGDGIQLDASGNVVGARLRSILAGLKVRQGRGKAGVFAGTIKGTRGIWQGAGRGVKPLFIFTTAGLQYQPRLDFTGVAERTATTNMQPEFARALSALLAR